MSAPGVVGFDLDGTLIDSVEGIHSSLVVACEALQLPSPTLERLRRRIGPALPHYLPDLLGLTSDQQEGVLAELLPLFRVHHDQQGWRGYQLYEGVPAMLKALVSAGWELHMVTQKPRQVAEKILEDAGLTRSFQSLQAPDGSAFSKGASLQALRRGGVPQHWYVGDTEADQRAAAAAGFRFVAATYGYGDCPVADARISAPLELLVALATPAQAHLRMRQ